MKATTPTPKVYYPQIDALRFFAFLMVFLHHTPSITGSAVSKFVQQMGAYGVDLFFVISSFLLFDLLYKENDRFGKVDVTYFLIRRVLRIWPLYFFALAVLSVLSILLHGVIPDLPRLAGMALFLDNVNTFATGQAPPLFAGAHLWTISTEEQFYLAVPVITLLLIRLGPRSSATFLAGLFVLTIAIRSVFLGIGLKHPSIWVMHVARLEPFILGFTVAYIYNRYRIPKGTAFAALAVSAILVIAAYLPEGQPFRLFHPHSRFAITFVAFMLTGLFVFVLNHGNSLRFIFHNRAIVFLGKISYGLYVWHLLAFELFWEYFDFVHGGERRSQIQIDARDWIVEFGIVLALTFGMAVVTYFLIEKPFVRLKRRFTFVANR